MNVAYSFTTESGGRDTVVTFLRRLLNLLRRWHARRETIRRLSALDDRILRDIGLHRSEIGAVADQLCRAAAPWREARASGAASSDPMPPG